MKFLCRKHREQILSLPSVATRHWDHWMGQGIASFEGEQWSKACQLLGCSYEAAEWLLQQPEEISPEGELTYIDRYMVAGHHLAESYGRQGFYDRELYYLVAVHRRLLRLSESGNYQHWPLKQNLSISLLMLARYCQLHGRFSGYECFVRQAEQHIQMLDRSLH